MSWLGNKTAQEQLELKHLCIDNFPKGINKTKNVSLLLMKSTCCLNLIKFSLSYIIIH